MANLRISDMEFAYGQTPLLRIDDLQLNAGEQLFLHGPSGSGKSTLLNLLAGVLLPQTGRIEIADTAINHLSARQRDRFRGDHIGYIFQQFNLIPYLNLLDNLMVPMRLSKIRRQKAVAKFGNEQACAEHWLAKLDLPKELWAQPVASLSLGQQQRVAAARAMMGAPELMIADEPTSSLDRARQQGFVDALLELCSTENMTLLFVSHDPSLAAHFSRQQDLSEWRL